jgi:hypothetical protein
MTWRIEREAPPEALAVGEVPSDWPQLTVPEIVRNRPDSSLAAREGPKLVARCSIWWNDVPPLAGHTVGAIGHFAASDATAAKAILDSACRQLQQAGCTIAVGPMDGNTWRKYRLVVETGTEPPFFLEPTNPASWPMYFMDSGFGVLATYSSGLNSDLAVRDPRADDVEARFTERGVKLRALNPADFTSELHRIYSVVEVSFRPNFLYTPLPEAEFAEQYAAIRQVVMPELVVLAEHEGRTVGFLFCVPDVLEQRRTGTLRTGIIKTMAVLPERSKYGGLGTLMADRTHRRAQELGLSRMIHALMHDTNQSRNISDRTGSTMRRYALFARELK